MSSETYQNSEWKQIKSSKSKITRKMYNREDFFRLYKCFEEIPYYLKDFEYLYNNFIEDNWCKKPIPKFEELTQDMKGKSNYSANKSRIRLRTLSNQSGDENMQDISTDNYRKQRNYNRYSGKFNRLNTTGSFSNEAQQSQFDFNTDKKKKIINTSEPIDQYTEEEWTRNYTPNHSNFSKPYSQNLMYSENHWKKWTKDHTPVDKNKVQNVTFNRPERPNNIWNKKNDQQNIDRNVKSYGRQGYSKSDVNTEDIWQDDWDTEMKSEIAKVIDDHVLEEYELPNSTIISIASPNVEEEQKAPVSRFDNPADPSNSQFQMWYYRDLGHQERGPFQSENMANWFATGFFNPSTFVRRQCDERFLLIAEYRALYGRIPFTAGQAIPPIYKETPVEIDIKQLLIGVDVDLIPQVINCATSLPKMSQPQISHNNAVPRIEENIHMNTNAAERLALIEEKRMIEESRLELERERERMNQEMVQLRERFEAEFKAMEEIKQSLANSSVSTLEQQSEEINVGMISIEAEKETEIEKLDISITSVNEEDKPCIVDISIPVKLDATACVPQNEKLEVSSIEKESNQWFSTKDMKNQRKNKKPKSKEISSKEEKEIVKIPEPKRPDIPTDSKIMVVPKESFTNSLLKENAESSKSKPMKIELNRRSIEPTGSWTSTSNQKLSVSNTAPKSILEIQEEEMAKNKEKQSQSVLIPVELDAQKITDNQTKVVDSGNRKTDGAVTWNVAHLPSANSKTLPVTKSLLEIQAEEQLKEKKQRDLEDLLKAKENEANRVTSFKESLLKTSKQVKPALIPVGKSIWDMSPMEISVPPKSPASVTDTVAKAKESDIKSSNKISIKESTSSNKKEINNNSDQLTLWCMKKLSRFSEKFDVQTVIELMKEVPNEDVMDLALQMIDDSKFINNFVEEFKSKRQELLDNQNREDWHTVKKPVVTQQTVSGSKVPIQSSKNPVNKSSKSKSKKKVFVLDAKFR